MCFSKFLFETISNIRFSCFLSNKLKIKPQFDFFANCTGF